MGTGGTEVCRMSGNRSRGDTGLDTGDCYTIKSRLVKDGLLGEFTFRPPLLITLTRFIADATGRPQCAKKEN